MIANFTNAANGKKSMEEKKKEVLAYLEKEREWVDYAILNTEPLIPFG